MPDSPLRAARLTRRLVRLSGPEARPFLQDLVTNDVTPAAEDRAVYAALLTPQGKFVADFLVLGDGPEDLVLDVDAAAAPPLAQALARYRLRRPVGIAEAPWAAYALWGAPAPQAPAPQAPAPQAPAGARLLPDPRDPALGHRLYVEDPAAAAETLAALAAAEAPLAAYDALRVAAAVPATGVELTPDTYILEAGFERLNGVDFRKGCFVGQEIVARMKHKTDLRKGLVRVAVEGPAPAPGAEILSQDGRPAGALYTTAGGEGLAQLRFDRASGAMTSGEAVIRRLD
ncbi:MAG: folate-binding protein [Pseudomonadota bacterium]